MKIIIEKGKISREIEGAFNICGSKEDLENLALQLNEGLKHDFYYGWIRIHVEQKLNTNNTPLSWEDAPSEPSVPVKKSCSSCDFFKGTCLGYFDNNYSHFENSEVYL